MYTVSVAQPQTSECTVKIFLTSSVNVRGRVARRFLLTRAKNEQSGFGLYSYLLLTPDEGDEDSASRNKKALESWYRRILAVAPLELRRAIATLNATFVPVKRSPPEDFDAGWVLANYDYNRAEELLGTLPKIHTKGPVLVSSALPLSKRKSGPLLVLDASWATPSTVGFWIDEFKNLGAQEDFHKPDSMRMFHLKLRTAIGVLAGDLPKVRDAVASIVSLSKSVCCDPDAERHESEGYDTAFSIRNESGFTGACSILYSGTVIGLGPYARPQTTRPIEPGETIQFSLSSGGSHDVNATPGFEGCLAARCYFRSGAGTRVLLDGPDRPVGLPQPITVLKPGQTPESVDAQCVFNPASRQSR